jgi:hypothetical protein
MFMLRRSIATTLFVLICLTGAANGGEKKGKFVKYDKQTKALTLKTDDGTEAMYTLADETKVVTAKGERTPFTIESFADVRVAHPGACLAVVYEETAGKVVKVTQIKIGGK